MATESTDSGSTADEPAEPAVTPDHDGPPEPAFRRGAAERPGGKRTSSGRMEAWQNYGLALVLIGFLPLLPAAIEWLSSREISEDTLIITVAVYCLTIAVASNNRLYFGLLITISVLISSIYGGAADPKSGSHVAFSIAMGIHIASYSKSVTDNNTAMIVVTILTFVTVLVERFSRHVRGREEFFEFLKGKGR